MIQVVPLIGISCCFRTIDVANIGQVRHHTVYEMYADYVRDVLGAAPVLIPALYEAADTAALAVLTSRLDGLLLTGSPSNVCLRPDDQADHGFAEVEGFVGSADLKRDWTTLPLLRQALQDELPVLGICRGMQEMNVLHGGSMVHELHLQQGRMDHRSDKTVPYWDRYGPAHRAIPQPGSWIANQLKQSDFEPDPDLSDLQINSLHTQAVDLPGNGIEVELRAEDGTIEAIRIENAKSFAYGVQWHIEWHHDCSPLNVLISNAFRAASQTRAHRLQGLAS
ncbi:MAG: gamma-glutamyl-gamma-aminobutyrate hydrolase family protein [Pseudophaeobacter sp.]|uniref:gamma-glutamyl-gamma-aminobutyrate hydrolase family protein n=1 Tax=Pseudophaeobacter sp. TaxID=1971739 RepID=UPI0032981F6D